MIKPGRIPCINPMCKRTAAADKFEPNTQIVCNKCFRSMPERYSRRYRMLNRALKKAEKTGRRVPAIEAAINRNWQAMWMYFNRPDKPRDLGAFLEEMGWANG